MQCLWRSVLKYMISNNMDYQLLYFPVFLICECFFPSEDKPTMPPPSGHHWYRLSRGGNPADVVTAQKKRFKVNAEAFLGPLVGVFKYFLCSSLLEEMIQFDEHIFQMGWSHRLVHFRGRSFTIFMDLLTTVRQTNIAGWKMDPDWRWIS